MKGIAFHEKMCYYVSMKDLLAMDGLSIAVIVIVAVLMAVLLAELIALVVISNKKDKKGGDEVATDEPAPEEPITEESASEEESVGEEPAEEPAVAPQPGIAIAAATVPPFGDANRMSRSFMAKLIQCGGLMQERYGAVKNELLSYNKVKSRLGWSGEAFRRGRATVAKLAIRGKTLVICLGHEVQIQGRRRGQEVCRRSLHGQAEVSSLR